MIAAGPTAHLAIATEATIDGEPPGPRPRAARPLAEDAALAPARRTGVEVEVEDL